MGASALGAILRADASSVAAVWRSFGPRQVQAAPERLAVISARTRDFRVYDNDGDADGG
ncbi:MAG: hypothetical protein WDA27_02005 [Actinomycetota bacterium]